MRITDIRLFKLAVPLKTPFRTALRTVERMESVIVEVHTDTEHIGRGEAPATAVITGDTLPSIAWAVEGVIGPRLIGGDIEERELLLHRVHTAMVHNTSAKAALDMALYDLYGQHLGVPLWKLLGGFRNTVETDLTISVGTADSMAADSLRAVEEGYRILKVKVGRDSAGDLDRLRRIREAVPRDIRIRVDANQGWTPKEAVRIIRAMEDQGLEVELVEQPVRADDLEGLRFVTSHVLTDILADEAVFSLRDGVELIQARAADLINIKLMKTGGLYQAELLCGLAQAYGVGCMMGCMLEGGVAATAAAHFAAAKENVRLADLDGPSLGRFNPVLGGARFDGPVIRLPDAPGLGITGVQGLEVWA